MIPEVAGVYPFSRHVISVIQKTNFVDLITTFIKSMSEIARIDNAFILGINLVYKKYLKGKKMKVPTKEKSEMYKITHSEFGVVHVTDNDRFKVSIRPSEELCPDEKFKITIRDDDYFEFDTFEEVKEHLLEKAEETYKKQFQ